MDTYTNKYIQSILKCDEKAYDTETSVAVVRHGDTDEKAQPFVLQAYCALGCYIINTIPSAPFINLAGSRAATFKPPQHVGTHSRP